MPRLPGRARPSRLERIAPPSLLHNLQQKIYARYFRTPLHKSRASSLAKKYDKCGACHLCLKHSVSRPRALYRFACSRTTRPATSRCPNSCAVSRSNTWCFLTEYFAPPFADHTRSSLLLEASSAGSTLPVTTTTAHGLSAHVTAGVPFRASGSLPIPGLFLLSWTHHRRTRTHNFITHARRRHATIEQANIEKRITGQATIVLIYPTHSIKVAFIKASHCASCIITVVTQYCS